MNTFNEQDQINELKAWWDEYGRSAIFGIVLAVLAVGGWNFWDQYENQKSEQASDIYYQMMDAYQELEKSINQNPAQKEQGTSKNERMVKLASFQEAANNLKKQYSTSEYAHFARLQAAKYFVMTDDLNSAENELKEVLENRPSKEIEMLTRFRLARVLLANGNLDEASKALEVSDAGAYRANFLEIQGDIALKRGDSAAAFEAYKLATEESEQPSESLNLKYYNLLSQ